MLKSIALATAVLSLNAGSFNIQPKEVVWTDNVTQEGSWISNETINNNYILDEGGDLTREVYVINKNIYTYNDQYVNIDTTIITTYLLEIPLDQTGQEVYGWSGNTVLDITTTIYTHYKSFNLNTAELYNIYNNQKIYTNFSDNKGTTYNYNPTTIFFEQNKLYNATTQTKQAIAEIKNALTLQQIINGQSSFTNALSNTNKQDIENTKTITNKTINLHETIEGYEHGEAYTYTLIQLTPTLTLTYNNELLTTDTQMTNWYQNFNEIISGQETWNYKATSTNQSTIANSVSLSVDSGDANYTEVIDIGGLMWDIIGMPFTFINQAFNVTLFAGTIYEFNIGNLIKGIIAILSLLFIIKLFTRGIDVLGEYNNTIGSARDRRLDRAYKKENQQMKRESHAKEMATNKNEKTVTVINKKE